MDGLHWPKDALGKVPYCDTCMDVHLVFVFQELWFGSNGNWQFLWSYWSACTTASASPEPSRMPIPWHFFLPFVYLFAVIRAKPHRIICVEKNISLLFIPNRPIMPGAMLSYLLRNMQV